MNPTEKALAFAETLGGKDGLNCISEIDPTAREQARKREAEQGARLPLHGIPVLVKDNIDVRGLHTTAGSLALADNLAAEDADVVRNLRKNGAVILGKTNMTEFANYVAPGMPGGYSSRGGQVIHADNPEVNPSGSSSGSAVAVAAGIVPMAVGTDTAFSITYCAQINGICGLKPAAGTLSPTGIVPLAKTLDSAGPMARNFEDTLKMYSAMRKDPLPEICPARPETLRIAVNTFGRKRTAEEHRNFLNALAESLREGGAEVREISQESSPYLETIMKREFGPGLEEYLKGSTAKRKTLAKIVEYYEAHPDTMMKYGDGYLRAALDDTPGGLQGAEYREALEAREKTAARVSREISDLDAVIMTGMSNIMHFCGLPTVTVAGNAKNASGVRQAVILYGTDEARLYAAALLIEKVLKR